MRDRIHWKSLLPLALLGGVLGCRTESLPPVAPEWDALPTAGVEAGGPEGLEELLTPERVFTASGGPTAFPAGSHSLQQLRELRFQYELTGAGVGDRASLDLLGPANEPYDKKTAALVGDGTGPQTLSFVLPVAGTIIDEAKLTGEWTARLSVNGEEVLVQRFGITP